MPTYEYACTACGHRLEVTQKFTDDPLTECPDCGGELRKVYAPVGIVLKGSGFYKTDSRAAAGKNGSSKKGADSETSSSGDTSKSTSDSDGSKSKSESESTSTSTSKDSAPAASSTS